MVEARRELASADDRARQLNGRGFRFGGQVAEGIRDALKAHPGLVEILEAALRYGEAVGTASGRARLEADAEAKAEARREKEERRQRRQEAEERGRKNREERARREWEALSATDRQALEEAGQRPEG